MVCVEEVPLLKQLRAKYADGGLMLIGVSVDEEQAPLTRMIAEKSIDWPQVWDGPAFTGAVAKAYATDGTPLIYLIDRAGRIAGRYRSIKNIERDIVEVMAAPVGGPPRTERDTWQRPYELMDRLAIAAGNRVADIGSGEGYFTFHLAARVGPGGKVHAVDINDAALDRLRSRAQREKLAQVDAVRGSSHDPRLPENSLDAVLIVDAYHEFAEYEAMLRAIYRALRPGGRLGIVDHHGPLGRPRKEYQDRHQIPAEVLLEDAARQGFRLKSFDADFADMHRPVKSYLMVLEKPASPATQ